jgi:hypothetical protein
MGILQQPQGGEYQSHSIRGIAFKKNLHLISLP